MRTRYILSTLIFIFLPAISQVRLPDEGVKADTARLFHGLEETRQVKKEIVDSIIALRIRVDSANASKNDKVFRRYFHIDYLNGKRVVWVFIYHVHNGDTLFQRVHKIHTKWK